MVLIPDVFFHVAFQGAARMVLQNAHPAQIKDAVCSTLIFSPLSIVPETSCENHSPWRLYNCWAFGS